MNYNDMPVIIPLLATGYLLTIYLLLTLAQRTIKSSGYAANSLTGTYGSYLSTEPVHQLDEIKRRSRSEPQELRSLISSVGELSASNAVSADALGHSLASSPGVVP